MKKLFNIRSDAYILRLDFGSNPCTKSPLTSSDVLYFQFKLQTSNLKLLMRQPVLA